MTIQTLEYASMAALADMAARRLATTAITNLELREALHTSKVANGVRIGDCEITYREELGERIYDIEFNGELVFTNVVFYETARYLVSRLNEGTSARSCCMKQVVSLNDSYRRARETARFHADRMQHYADQGNDFKADLNEDRFSRAIARVRIMRDRLMDNHARYL